MTAQARANGWRGFDGIGRRVERVPGAKGSRGGWEYLCDGTPRPMGCGESLVTTRRLARVGEKSTGWLVTYGKCMPDEPADDDKGHDLDVVLTVCPSCAAVVREQEARRVQAAGRAPGGRP